MCSFWSPFPSTCYLLNHTWTKIQASLLYYRNVFFALPSDAQINLNAGKRETFFPKENAANMCSKSKASAVEMLVRYSFLLMNYCTVLYIAFPFRLSFCLVTLLDLSLLSN